MIEQLIEREFEEYQRKSQALDLMLEKVKEQTEAYAQSGKANQGYINKMNWILGTVHRQKEAVQNLLDAIATANSLLTTDYLDAYSLRNENERLRSEARKMRTWLAAIGKDPNLIPYLNETDFRTYPYSK